MREVSNDVPVRVYVVDSSTAVASVSIPEAQQIALRDPFSQFYAHRKYSRLQLSITAENYLTLNTVCHPGQYKSKAISYQERLESGHRTWDLKGSGYLAPLYRFAGA